MTKRRRRKPIELGVYIDIYHPESMEDRRAVGGFVQAEEDEDGHLMKFQVAEMHGEALAHVTVRRGLSAESAAAILRKLADTVAGVGHVLLTLKRGVEGARTPDGSIKLLEFSLDLYDDDGNQRPLPEIAD